MSTPGGQVFVSGTPGTIVVEETDTNIVEIVTPGPQGIQGSPGAPGAQGPQGPPGPSGGNFALSISGNTSGTPALISTGTAILAGGPNITLSQVGQSITISGGAGGAGGGIALSAAGQSVSSGTVTLSNSNNVSFGMAASVVTASASFAQSTQTQPAGGIAGTATSVTGNASLTLNSNGLAFNGSGLAGTSTGAVNISVTLNSSGISLSAPATVAQTGISSIIVSNTTYTSGAVSFSNANGITFGSSAGQAITASYNSTQFAGTGTSVTGNASITLNSNGLALNAANLAGTGFATTTSAGSVIAGTHNTTGLTLGVPPFLTTQSVQTQASGAIAGTGTSITGNASITLNSVGLAFNGSGLAGTSTGAVNISVTLNSSGISLSAPAVGGAQTGISGIQVSNTTYTSGTVTFQNANGISFGSSGANGVSASYTVPTQTNQTLSWAATSNTAGNTSGMSVDARSLTLAGYGIASVGYSTSAGGSSIVVSATQSNQAVSAQGGSSAFQTLVFTNSNNVSFSNTGGSVWGSYALNVSATGGTSNAVSGLTFQNSNGVSFGLSTGAGVGSLTASVAAQSNQQMTLYATSNTTQSSTGTTNASSVIFAGAGNISVGITNGSIVISGAAPAAQTGISGIQVSNTTYTSGTVTFQNANGISFGSSGANGISASYTVPVQSNQTLSFAATSNTAGNTSGMSVDARSLTLAGYGNASVGFSTSAGGSSIVVSVTTAAQTNQTLGLYASSQTTAQSSSSTVDARSLTIVGQGNISVGLSAGSFIISQTGGGGGGWELSAGASSQSTGTIVFSNSNNVSFGMSTAAAAAATVTATASYPTTQALYFLDNTVGQSSTSTAADQSLSYSLGGALSGGWTNGSILLSAPQTSSLSATGHISISVNGSTISIGDFAAGSGFTSGSTTGNWAATLNSTGLSEVIPYRTRVVWPHCQLTAISAPGNASASFQYVAVYAPATGTRIDALASWSAMGSAATTATAAIAMSAYAVIYTRNVSTLSSLSSGSTQTTYSYASNTAGHTEFLSAAMRPISVPVNFNMQAGEYLVGFNLITATSSIGASTTSFGLTLSMMGGNQNQTAANYAEIGSQTASSSNLFAGMGVYASATTGMPAAASLSAIAQTGSSLSQANIALVFRNA